MTRADSQKQLTPRRLGVAALFSALMSLALPQIALSQQTPAPAASTTPASGETTQLEAIEVTGSRLSRKDLETPSPVVTISRQQIESTGATSLGEILKIITSNEGGISESQTLGFAAGESSINLRGLGAQYSLVLLNGRRMAPYGRPNVTSANIEPSVNLDSVPVGAIERIEILPNGGSAIYGSDAVAGVVNIITKKNYTGTDLSAYYGQAVNSTYSGITNLSLTSGQMTSGVQTLFFINWYKNQGMPESDRGLSADQRALGGLDLRSSVGYPATVYLDNGTSLDQVNLCPLADQNGTCKTDRNTYTPIDPPAQRLSAYASISKDLVSADIFSMSAYFEALFNQSNVHTGYYPTPVSTFIDPALFSGQNNPFTQAFINQYNTDNGTSYNPVQDVSMRFDFRELGPRLDDYEDNQNRFVLGFKGGLAGWNYDLGGLYSQDKNNDFGDNYTSRNLITQALTTGIDVLGTGTPEYLNVFGGQFGVPAANGGFPNTPELVNALRIRLDTRAISGIKSIDLTAGGPIFPLVDQQVSLSVGVERRLEDFFNAPDSQQSGGNVVALSTGTPVGGNRGLTSIYTEADIPVLKYAEIQLAARHEDYSDFGTVTKPKIAVKVTPVDWVILRAGIDKGFRAPSLADLFAAQSTAFQNGIIDTARCNAGTATAPECDGSGLFQITVGGNPTLKPEESKSFYYGFVVEPVSGLALGMTAFDVKIEDVITTLPAQLLVDTNDPSVIIRGAPTGPGDPGPILNIFNGFLNGAFLETKGFDADIGWSVPSWMVPAGFGRFKADLAATYIDKYKYSDPNIPEASYAGSSAFGVALPRVKGNAAVHWEIAIFDATARVNHIGAYNDDFGFGYKVGVYDTLDLQGGVQVPFVKGLKASVGVNNVFDKAPPYAVGANFYSATFLGYDPSLYSAQGRFGYLTLGYNF